MRDELKVFENRSDDWLAKERSYEESISAWDLDEGKKLKESHEKHHANYNKTHAKGVIGKPIKQEDFVSVDSSKIFKTIIIVIVVSIIAVILVRFFSLLFIDASSIIEFVPFIIFILVFASFTRRKKK